MPIAATLKLPGYEAFEAAILRVVAENLRVAITRAGPGIERGVREVLDHALRSSPDYAAARADRLWHELGIPDPDKALGAIVDALVAGVVGESLGCRVAGRQLQGGLRLAVWNGNYEELLGLNEASFTTLKGVDVPWLRWLLTAGEQLVIADYTFLGGDRTAPWSRTGWGIMVKSKRGWHVPSEFAGTPDDNWITRVFGGLDGPLLKVIEEELQRNL